MSDRPWLGAYPAGVPADIDPSQYPSLVALMEEAFSRYADRVAYSFMGKELTYSQVDAQSRAFAAYLQSLGDRKSTRLNSSHLVISYAVFCLKKKTVFNTSEDL